MSSNNNKYPAPAVMGDESIMSKKAHGTSAVPVQENLRWKVDQDTADRISNFNRHYAEHSGYFQSVSDFLKEAKNLPATDEITFYDSNTGKPLFFGKYVLCFVHAMFILLLTCDICILYMHISCALSYKIV